MNSFVRKIFNIFVESGSFGLFGAPFEGTKSAIKAVENLNQQFVSLYMDMQEIKDSVFQAEELKVYNNTEEAINEFDIIISLSARKRDVNKKHIKMRDFSNILLAYKDKHKKNISKIEYEYSDK